MGVLEIISENWKRVVYNNWNNFFYGNSSDEQPNYSGIVSTEEMNSQEVAIFISRAVLPYLNECIEIGMVGTFGLTPKKSCWRFSKSSGSFSLQASECALHIGYIFRCTHTLEHLFLTDWNCFFFVYWRLCYPPFCVQVRQKRCKKLYYGR